MTPRITFGMIVLNGEPFVRYNLRSLYQFAHQIIVVEGACRSAAAAATPDGHSRDGTLDTLERFQAEEDPEQKLIMVTASDEGYADGFWPEKDEMSRAYASRATGNYLWQIDVDEFYCPRDMEIVMELLREGADAVTFPTLHFWGDIAYTTNGFLMICERYDEYRRLFAWGPGYTYERHRPPTVLDSEGVDVHRKRSLSARAMKAKGVSMFHYAYLFPQQTSNKILYYSTPSDEKSAQGGGVIAGVEAWGNNTYLGLEHPFRVHMVHRYVSWLERYKGEHPEQILQMVKDLRGGALGIAQRRRDDIELLLSRRSYWVATRFLRHCAYFLASPIGRPLRRAYAIAKGIVRHWRQRTVWKTVRRKLGWPSY